MWLGAGVAAWVVWGLTKPSAASAAQSGPAPSSLPAATLPSNVPASTATQLPPDPFPSWTLLAQGSTGENVRTWQRALVAAKLLPAAGVDGIYGTSTFNATKVLQQKGGVKIDGIVGPDTRRAARTLGFW